MGRTLTIIGTGGRNIIDETYRDAAGASIYDLQDNDSEPGVERDTLIVRAMGGNDVIDYQMNEGAPNYYGDLFTLDGGDGHDTISAGSPSLDGGVTYGHAILGGAGDDVISFAGSTIDIDAGSGDDIIFTSANAWGADITGGTGADLFEVAGYFVHNVIQDFEVGRDRLVLHHIDQTRINANTAADRVSYVQGEDVAGGALLTYYHYHPIFHYYSHTTEVMVVGASVAQLQAGNTPTGIFDGTRHDDSIWIGSIDMNHDRIDGVSDIVQAGAGDDSIFLETSRGGRYDGGIGADEITLRAAAGGWVSGGVGDDTLWVAGRSVEVQGGLGADTLTATGRGHNLNGGNGNDEINGNSLVGGFVFGGMGDDTIRLSDGRTTAHGNLGDDLIVSEYGNCRLTGGGGDDTLRVTVFGSNSLAGNAGADRFEFVTQPHWEGAVLRVEDFTAGEDTLWFNGYALSVDAFTETSDDGWAVFAFDTHRIELVGVPAPEAAFG